MKKDDLEEILATPLDEFSFDGIKRVLRMYAPNRKYIQQMSDKLREEIETYFPPKQQTVQIFLDMYCIAKQFDSKKKDKSDRIRELIKNNMKEGQQISEKMLAQYSIEYFIVVYHKRKGCERKWDEKKCKSSKKKYNIYMDAQYGFGLMYCNEPVAVVGFEFKDRGTVFIRQLQGAQPRIIDKNGYFVKRGNTWEIAHFYWPKVLVEYVALWAEKNGFEKLGIQSARNNEWKHISFKRMQKFYDDPAKELGFKKNKEDKNWYKAL